MATPEQQKAPVQGATAEQQVKRRGELLKKLGTVATCRVAFDSEDLEGSEVLAWLAPDEADPAFVSWRDASGAVPTQVAIQLAGTPAELVAWMVSFDEDDEDEGDEGDEELDAETEAGIPSLRCDLAEVDDAQAAAPDVFTQGEGLFYLPRVIDPAVLQEFFQYSSYNTRKGAALFVRCFAAKGFKYPETHREEGKTRRYYHQGFYLPGSTVGRSPIEALTSRDAGKSFAALNAHCGRAGAMPESIGFVTCQLRATKNSKGKTDVSNRIDCWDGSSIWTIEFDHGTQEQQEQWLAALNLPMSLIDTGGKSLHGYIETTNFLDAKTASELPWHKPDAESIDTQGPEVTGRLQAICIWEGIRDLLWEAVVRTTGQWPDPSAMKLVQVMRLPGSVHPATGKVATVLQVEAPRLTIQDLHAHLSELCAAGTYGCSRTWEDALSSAEKHGEARNAPAGAQKRKQRQWEGDDPLQTFWRDLLESIERPRPWIDELPICERKKVLAECLEQFPPRVPGSNTYPLYRDLLMGTARAVGQDEIPWVVELFNEHSPEWNQVDESFVADLLTREQGYNAGTVLNSTRQHLKNSQWLPPSEVARREAGGLLGKRKPKALASEETDAGMSMSPTQFMVGLNEIRNRERNPALMYLEMERFAASHGDYRKTGPQLEKALIEHNYFEDCSTQNRKLQWWQGVHSMKFVIAGLMLKPTSILLHGPGGVGKTQTAMALAKYVGRGLRMFVRGIEVPVEKGNVLWVQNDQSLPKLIRDCRDNGIDPEVDSWFIVKRGFQLNHTYQMSEWIQEHKPVLVVVDSITSCSTKMQVVEKDSAFAAPFYHYSERNGDPGSEGFPATTFLWIHHDNAQGEARGNKLLVAAIDEQWHLRKPVDSEEETMRGKGHAPAQCRMVQIKKSRLGREGDLLVVERDENYMYSVSDFTPTQRREDNGTGNPEPDTMTLRIVKDHALDARERGSDDRMTAKEVWERLVEEMNGQVRKAPSQRTVERWLGRWEEEGLLIPGGKRVELGSKKPSATYTVPSRARGGTDNSVHLSVYVPDPLLEKGSNKRQTKKPQEVVVYSEGLPNDAPGLNDTASEAGSLSVNQIPVLDLGYKPTNALLKEGTRERATASTEVEAPSDTRTTGHVAPEVAEGDVPLPARREPGHYQGPEDDFSALFPD